MNDFLIGLLILALLLLIVLWNNRANMRKQNARRHRNFGANYQLKKKKNKKIAKNEDLH